MLIGAARSFWKEDSVNLCYLVLKFSKFRKIDLKSGTSQLCKCLSGKLHTASVTPSRTRINILEHLQHLINSIFINAPCKKLFYSVIETTSSQVLLLIKYNWSPNVYFLVKATQLFLWPLFQRMYHFLTQVQMPLWIYSIYELEDISAFHFYDGRFLLTDW